jgi:ribosome biogenesis GTPase / thiamine phosphate phosphatase
VTAPVPVLEAIGWDLAWQEAFASHSQLGVAGRVVRVDRGLASVLTADGLVRASLGATVLEAMLADTLAAPCTGDWVVARHWPDGPITVETVLPRRTAVARAEASRRSRGQVLAANVDIAALVVALQPEPNMGRLERLLSLAWESGAAPLVVLTKADMVSDAGLIAEDVARVAPGVEVICTSTVTGQGIDGIRARLDGRLTLALLGSSGHGKSSLTNALVGADVLTTKRIRADGRGRHTTVRRELVVLPTGGAVVDTPGLRGIGLLDTGDGLSAAFPDLADLARRCRFSDCSHRTEPGCAVLAAIDDGVLAVRRLSSWRMLQREQTRMAARTDARLRAELDRQRKHLSKQAKARMRNRP